MGMEKFKANPLPVPTPEYDPGYMRQLIRVLELYFKQLDSDTPLYVDDVYIGGDSLLSLINNLPLTAFGDLRTAELSPVFQYSFEYTVDNTELTTNVVTNGGTVTQANAMAVVTSSTTTASTAKLMTSRHAKYRAGLGGVIRFTSLFTTPVAATEQLIGLTDEAGSSQPFKNGYTIGYIGTVFGFHRFSNDTLTTIALADWDDPLDGTGASGETIDPTKLNVFFIQFQYLGAGAIKIWYEVSATGKMAEVHVVPYANLKTEPSVYMPNFNGTLWVNNKATTSNLIAKGASIAYFVEGKSTYIELQQVNQSSGSQEKTTVTSEVAIFTIRNKTTYASKTNFIDIALEGAQASIEANSANNLGHVRLVKNATLGGTPSYSDISTTNSVVDIDTAGTTVTGGTELVSTQLAGKNDRENANLTDYDFIIAPGETVTLAGSSANSATIDASLLWKELF